jgi:hypothetical protein
METIQGSILEYKKQMQKGLVQQAYRGIMEYVMQLRTYFQKKYPEYSTGNIYNGYMDMTYFPLFPKSLKKRKLKIAIVFIHNSCRFEVWLSGNNRQIQHEYSTLIKESKWGKYRMDPNNPDSIIEDILVEDPDFSNPDELTKGIETSTLSFIRDVEAFLSK